jgi:hypothetical protein
VTERRTLEWWIALVRLGAVPFAVLQVAATASYPADYRQTAWILTAIFGVGAVGLFAAVRQRVTPTLEIAAMAFDFGIISAFVVLYSFEAGTPTRALRFVAIVLGASRFGLYGGIAVALATVPVAAWFEQRRSDSFGVGYRWDFVTFQAGAGLVMALLAGWLVTRLEEERATTERRAEEAEALRDELGRRADLLEAANRCARALGSSLDVDEAFGAFIRELRGLVPFERMAIVLAEEGVARVLAVSGAHADEVMPPGTQLGLERNLLAEVVERGRRCTAATCRRSSTPRSRRCSRSASAVVSSRRSWPARGASASSRSAARARTRSRSRRSSSSACSAASPPARFRTSARTRASGGPSRSCVGCRRSGPTSSRSSRTSCAARWRR